MTTASTRCMREPGVSCRARRSARKSIVAIKAVTNGLAILPRELLPTLLNAGLDADETLEGNRRQRARAGSLPIGIKKVPESVVKTDPLSRACVPRVIG